MHTRTERLGNRCASFSEENILNGLTVGEAWF